MITKQTGVAVGVVISIATGAFYMGSAYHDIGVLSSRVQAIETDRIKSKDTYGAFQLEVISRLIRIETEVKKVPKGGN